MDSFDTKGKPKFEIEYSSSQDSSMNNSEIISESELPDSSIVGNYGSSDDDGIVDLMKKTGLGPFDFKSRYATYENLSLLP